MFVNFIGRLGLDAEVKQNQEGRRFLSLRVAVDEWSKGGSVTSWVNVTMDFASTNAEKMQPYLLKGKMIQVFGEDSIRLYTDKNNAVQASRDVRALKVNFVGGGSSSGSTASSDRGTVVEPHIETNTIASNMAQIRNYMKDVPSAEPVSFAAATNSDNADADLPF